MLRYVFIEGTYFLKDEEKLVSASDEVAVVFTVTNRMVIMRKHGSPEDMARWVRKEIKKFNQFGLKQEFMTVTGKFNVEELNKLISNSTYAPRFLAKNRLGFPKERRK